MDITIFKYKHFPDKALWKSDAKDVESSREVGAFSVQGCQLTPSCLQLNTITLVATLNVTFKLQVIVDHLKVVDPMSVEAPTKRASKTATEFKKKNITKVTKKTDFYNSLTWRFMVIDGETVMNLAVKVFPNGRLQFAGLRTVKACATVPHVVARYIQDIAGACNIVREGPSDGEHIAAPAVTISTRVHMIHTSFHIFPDANVYVIKQKDFARVLQENYRQANGSFVRSVEFNPSRHAGINIKWLSTENQNKVEDCTERPVGQISIFVFESGATIITGGKKFGDYKEVCSWLIKAINDNPSVVSLAKDWQKKPKKVKKKISAPETFHAIYNGAYRLKGKLKK